MRCYPLLISLKGYFYPFISWSKKKKFITQDRFTLVFFPFLFISSCLNLMPDLTYSQIMVLACLLGVIAVARSPSSAIVIINECRAAGLFTATVLGVIVAMDVLIIVFFTLAMTVSEIILGAGTAIDFHVNK